MSEKNVLIGEGAPVSEAALDMRVLKAMELHAAGEVAAALGDLESVLGVDPAHAPALHLSGVIAAETGDLESAELILRKAVELAPHAAEFHNSLGFVLHARGDDQAAARCFSEALQLSPEYADAAANLEAVTSRPEQTVPPASDARSTPVLAQEAREALERGGAVAALRCCSKLLADEGLSPITLEIAARAACAAGYPHAAVDLVERMLGLAPEQPSLYDALKDALQALPDDSVVLRLRQHPVFRQRARSTSGAGADAVAASDRSDSATVEEMDSAISRPEPAGMHRALQERCQQVERLLGKGELEQAAELAASFVARSHDHPYVQYVMALLNRCAGDLEAALEFSARAIERDPDFKRGWSLHKSLLAALGRPGEADNSWLRAEDREAASRPQGAVFAPAGGCDSAGIRPAGPCETSGGWDDHLLVAVEKREQGDLSGALVGCERILSANPGHAGALHLAGVISAESGDLETSEFLLRRAVEFGPNIAEYHNSLGCVLHARGNTRQAWDSFSRAVALRPDDKDALANLEELKCAPAETEVEVGAADTSNEEGGARQAFGALTPETAGFEQRTTPCGDPSDRPAPLELEGQAQGDRLAPIGGVSGCSADRQEVKRPELTFPAEVANYLQGVYSQAEVILEYGSGGSTVLASEMAGKRVVSVESDRAWARYMDSYFEQSRPPSLPYVFHVDVGPTGAWGAPKGESAWQRFHRYPLGVWDLEDFQEPDVVLVDGRFRVASFVTTFLRIRKPTLVLFDDYVNRPGYHVVERLVKPYEVVGRMAAFRLDPRNLPREHLTWMVGSFNSVA